MRSRCRGTPSAALLVLLAVTLALAAPGAAMDGPGTVCDADGTPAEALVAAAHLGKGESVGYLLGPAEGRPVTLNVHTAKYSHGSVAWALRDAVGGAVWVTGTAAEVAYPALPGSSPYDLLCLEVVNGAPSLLGQPVGAYAVLAPPA